jgi:hypothetical protein
MFDWLNPQCRVTELFILSVRVHIGHRDASFLVLSGQSGVVEY